MQERRREQIEHREENGVERFLLTVLEQLVNVGESYLGRKTGIDGAEASRFLVSLRAGEMRVMKMARGNAEVGKVRGKQRRVDIKIQDARDSNANLRAVLQLRLHAARENYRVVATRG